MFELQGQRQNLLHTNLLVKNLYFVIHGYMQALWEYQLQKFQSYVIQEIRNTVIIQKNKQFFQLENRPRIPVLL